MVLEGIQEETGKKSTVIRQWKKKKEQEARKAEPSDKA